jgi:protocatechuate 3,4-dioxygenase, beta subunit
MQTPESIQVTNRGIGRRAAGIALIAAPALWLGPRATAQTQALRMLTPSQTEGPFYPVAIPKDADFDLLRNGSLAYTKGQPVWVTGTVIDPHGKPVAGALVEIWQADHAGHYDHPGDGSKSDPAFQGFGRVTVAADGSYRFRTIRPVPYSGRAPHIHFKVKLGKQELLTTQLYDAAASGNARDFLWRNLGGDAERAALTVPFVAGADGVVARFDLVVRT